MAIPTEPIGSIPRPLELIEAMAGKDSDDPSLDPLYEAAIRDTVERFEETGSPVVTDGEQQALHAGFLVQVSKPIEPSELVATVASVLGRTGVPGTE